MKNSSLKGSIRVCGKSDSGLYEQTFNITRTINRGAAAICYEATYKHGPKGILKEFYPTDSDFLKRDENGQLVLDETADMKSAIAFRNAEKEYTKPFDIIQQAIKDSENNDIASFIPPFEIYHGCDENLNIIGTTYIWSPIPEYVTFESVCDDIHSNPGENPEHKLSLILTAIESLCECVESLHESAMIHRDIKPSNFGFVKRGNKILTQSISIFDIDSVCSMFDPERRNLSLGTDGFVEPEIIDFTPRPQTDIYAIGASLYYAIVNSPETRANEYLFDISRYDEIDYDVNTSALINACEANSHPTLKNTIVKILKKCLAPRDDRYDSCSEITDDIRKALFYARQTDGNWEIHNGEKWVLANASAALGKNSKKNSSLVMMCHLYEYPLYPDFATDSLNVMLFGFGNYGQKFLDICLQAGQINGTALNVTIFTDNLQDKDIYLGERPSLKSFFSIDNEKDRNGSYGRITFKKTRLSRDDHAQNKNIIQDIILEYQEDEKNNPHYIFIALGDDRLNMSAAEACYDATEILQIPCPVNFAREGKKLKEKLPDKLIPVYVCEDAKKTDIFPELERMAFNVHLVWQKNFNISISKLKKEFRLPYNYMSCLSYVIALKYKLHSIGIDIGGNNFTDAAEKFNAFIENASNKAIKDELVWFEHRRWVTEKLCLGWRSISNVNKCVTEGTKDERNKRHICIAKSRPEQTLKTPLWQENNCSHWDNATDSDLKALDPLDRVSVMLHRAYKKRADELRKNNLLNGNIIKELRLLTESSKTASVAFNEWYTCLKDICNNDRKKVLLYENLKEALRGSLNELPFESKKVIKGQIDALNTLFKPLCESLRYRDYKLDDIALIENIPFILTYFEGSYIVVPFSTSDDGDNTLHFSNLSSATVLNPARIIYLAYLRNEYELDDIMENLPYISKYMNKKNLRSAIDFVFIHSSDFGELLNEDTKEQIKALSNGRVRQIKVISYEDKSDVRDMVLEYIDSRRKGKYFFAVECNGSGISEFLEGAGFFKLVESFSYDIGKSLFKPKNGCSALSYVKKAPYVSINDIISLSNSSSKSSNQPEFFNDYEELWKKYRQYGMSATWKAMCAQLKEYSAKNDAMLKFKRKTSAERESEATMYRYILPINCTDVVRKIFNALSEQTIIEPGSSVNSYNSCSCEVIIYDKCGYKNLYDSLLSNPYNLMLHDAISIYLDTKAHAVCLSFDNLIVKNWSPTGNRANEIKELIRYLGDRNLLTTLQEKDDAFSFSYPGTDIKELLTTEGKLLEVYVYHKLKETNAFDDIVSSFEVNLDDTDVTSEFDVIATRGITTFIIECKATYENKQDYYYKLKCLARKYGINSQSILISDTLENPKSDIARTNTTQRQRGEFHNVTTVYKPQEIDNIGETLLKIAKGEYNKK